MHKRFYTLILIGSLSLTACVEPPEGLTFEDQTVQDVSTASNDGQTTTTLEPAPEPTPQKAPTPVSQISYSNQSLIPLDGSNIEGTVAVGVGEELKQTFQLRSPYALREDVSFERLILSISFWPGQIHDIDINVYDHEDRLIYTQKMTDWNQYQFIDPETALVRGYRGTKLIALDSPVDLKLNTDYKLGFKVNAAEHPLQLFTTKTDYPYTSNPLGKDIWFRVQVIAKLDQFGLHEISEDPNNQFYFDPGWQTPIKAKLLSVGSPAEKLLVSQMSDSGQYAYDVEDERIAQLAVSQSDGQATLSLSGLMEGETRLHIRYNGTIIETIELKVFEHRHIELSYQYIAYPGETDHELKYIFPEVSETISRIFSPMNITIGWTNQGVIEYEWDKNGDGNSYTPDRSEMWAPLNESIIPSADTYFSNMYVLRMNKTDDDYRGSNGGGTSFGFGPEDGLPRAGLVRIHLFRSPSSIASTLAHELAHNLGLSHYSSANYNHYPVSNEFLNLMKVGRTNTKLFAFQWTRAHETLKLRAAQGEVY